jgi:hypothetical protein
VRSERRSEESLVCVIMGEKEEKKRKRRKEELDIGSIEGVWVFFFRFSFLVLSCSFFTWMFEFDCTIYYTIYY